jgi:2-polyprenyl-3-methyl-5-hydroxy-6-metoxy-1,4-benzoquinol methylase
VRSYPEFREYFQNYPLKQSRDSSHDYVRRLVGSNQDVLDVACGEGALAAELQRNGNRVTGVDLLGDVSHPEAFEGYYSADLEQGLADVIDRLEDRQFDCVLLLDILEHLKSPDTLLMQCHRMLRPSGRLIVSLPNVAVITVRLALLFGRFDYAERGVLDRTHVRFFTRKTARRVLEDHGFDIVTEKMTLIPLELVVGLSTDNWLMKAANRMLALITWLMPGLFGYQMMFVGRSRRSTATGR